MKTSKSPGWQATGKPGIRQHSGSGHYQARYRAGDGAFRSKVFDRQRQAERWLREQRTSLDNGTHVDPSDRTTVAEFAVQWVETRPHRASTSKRHRGMVTHLTGSTLGSMKLAAVKPLHVQAWVAERSVLIAPSTLDRLFTFVRSVFKSAVQNGLLRQTPCVGIVLPEVERAEYIPLTVSEVKALADAVPSRYQAAVIVQGTCGLRIGELLGLQIKDFDRQNKVLHVRRQLLQDGKTLGPVKKMQNGVRTIPLPSHVVVTLTEHLLATPPSESGLLFTSAHGKGIRYGSYTERVFKPACRRAGLPMGTTTHDLRHHAASEMLHRGVPPASVARILGHSLTELLRTYAHAMPTGDDMARQAMSAAWAPDVSSGVSLSPLASV